MSRRRVRAVSAWTGVLFFFLFYRATPAAGCQRVGPVSAPEMIKLADAIVRVTAVEYKRAPSNPLLRTTGEPDSVVRFKVAEILKGKEIPAELLLPGYLSEGDDFNDHEPPYDFVRPGGRAGSCFANTYRTGAQFLLVLKGGPTTFTTDWYALGPVNEQLRSDSDPWLSWVRAEVKKGKN